jgi:hypothetical protein
MWSPKHETEYRLQTAVEDRFVIIKLHQPDVLLPPDDILDALDETLSDLPPHYIPICDLRGFAESDSRALTYDALDFIRGLGGDSY